MTPNFFWSYYNSGICYMNQKNTKDAILSFKTGLQLPVEPTIKHLLNSKVYLQYIYSNKISVADMVEHLRIGYQKAFIYLETLKEYDSIQDQNVKSQIWSNITKDAHPVLF